MTSAAPCAACAASSSATSPYFPFLKLKLAVHRVCLAHFPTSSGIMATVTARADRPLVVSSFNREQLIERGRKSIFVTPTLSDICSQPPSSITA
jgi:hypothetical protein